MAVRSLGEFAGSYFIGGSPCAGKSTVADLLAARHGLPVFHCDDDAGARQARVRATTPAGLRDYVTLSDCDRMARPPRWQADRELEFYRRQLPFVVEELARLPRPFLAEGADFLPESLDEAGVPHAAWLVPTPAFQREHYARRGWAWEYVSACPDPSAAFDTWMRRDVLFAEHVAADARRRGRPVVVVDGLRSLDDVTREVERALGLADDGGRHRGTASRGGRDARRVPGSAETRRE